MLNCARNLADMQKYFTSLSSTLSRNLLNSATLSKPPSLCHALQRNESLDVYAARSHATPTRNLQDAAAWRHRLTTPLTACAKFKPCK